MEKSYSGQKKISGQEKYLEGKNISLDGKHNSQHLYMFKIYTCSAYVHVQDMHMSNIYTCSTHRHPTEIHVQHTLYTQYPYFKKAQYS